MKFKKIVLAAFFTTLSTSSFAIMCPSNFTQIKMGDSIKDVIAACGKPDSQTEEEKNVAKSQEWVYYVLTDPSNQTTIRTTIAFDKDKVTNISANGYGVSYTQICAGNTVQVGDSQDSVKKACGKPAFINQDSNDKTPPVKTTTLIYNNPSKTSLIFVGGVLTDRQ